METKLIRVRYSEYSNKFDLESYKCEEKPKTYKYGDKLNSLCRKEDMDKVIKDYGYWVVWTIDSDKLKGYYLDILNKVNSLIEEKQNKLSQQYIDVQNKIKEVNERNF